MKLPQQDPSFTRYFLDSFVKCIELNSNLVSNGILITKPGKEKEEVKDKK